MSKKMEDRKPIIAEWNGLKFKHKALNSGNLFKPDLGGPIKAYDQALKSYTDLLEEKKKLVALFGDFADATTSDKAANGKLSDERDKMDKKGQAGIEAASKRSAPLVGKMDADPAEVLAVMNDYLTAREELHDLHKALSDQMFKHNMNSVAAAKKFRDSYKAKADVVTAGMKKAEGDSDRLAGQIRQIAAAYGKIAISMDHEEIVDDLSGLTDNL